MIGAAPDVAVKPRLRGWSHEIAFFVTLISGPALVLAAPSGHPRLLVSIYAASLSGLFGVSASFHRFSWQPAGRRRMRRLDHSMIFLAIAGTYTAIVGLTLAGRLATAILVAVWVGAAGGVVLKLVWIDAPKPLVAGVYVVLGWVAVAALPQLFDALGVGGFVLLVLGGGLYTAGAVVYARRRPDPAPAVFGYHEVFHLLVIAAAACHYATVAAYALPRA